VIIRLLEGSGPGTQRRLGQLGVQVLGENLEEIKLSDEDAQKASVVVHPGAETERCIFGDKVFKSKNHVLLVEPAEELAKYYTGPKIVPPGGTLALSFSFPANKKTSAPWHMADVFVLRVDI
jgi:hypothetical protein